MQLPAVSGDWLGHDQYLLKKQFFKLLGSNFRIYDPMGNLVLFAHQKAFKLKEDIRVYADEGQTRELLSIRARQIMDFKAAYDIVDSQTGQKVGVMRRKGWTSIIRDTWEILDAQDMPIGTIEEDQMALALVRRFLSNLVPQSFDITVNGQLVGEIKQRFNPFLVNLDIDFRHDPQRRVDRRLLLGAVCLIGAIEGRQEG